MHTISVILCRKELSKNIASRYINAKSVSLPQNMALIPVTELLINEVAELIGERNSSYDIFEDLDDSMAIVLNELSQEGTIAYVETHYFGGEGVQSSIVCEYNRIIYGPAISKNDTTTPINDALSILGVKVVSMHDEFDEVGLGRNRSTEKWFGCGDI